MKTMIVAAGALALIGLFVDGEAFAQSRADQCAAYARNAARNTPTSTGVVRGAVRGAVTARVLGGDTRGAARVGAVVGGTRRAAQKGRSYQFYFDQCMARR